MVNNRWLYWSSPLNSVSIAERKLEIVVRAIVTSIFFAVGIAGLAVFVLFWAQVQREVLLEPGWKTLLTDRRFFFFSCSLLADAYVAYRLFAASGRHDALPIGQAGTPPHQLRAAQDVLRLGHEERFALNHALSAESLHALESAWKLAKLFSSEELFGIYLFATLLRSKKITALRARLEVSGQRLHDLTQAVMQSKKTATAQSPRLGIEFHTTLFTAFSHAQHRRAAQVDITDLFAAVCTTQDVRDVLDELAITLDSIENVCLWMTMQEDIRRRFHAFRRLARLRPKGAMNRAMTATATPLLNLFSRDLTRVAQLGASDICIGRERELQQALQFLESGRHVLLVGDAGSGKSALLAGIAERMVSEDVPETLRDKRLIAIAVPELIAASARFGGPAAALEEVLNEATRASNTVLVFENIHYLLGAGADGAMDLAGVLSVALSERQLQVIGTIRTEEYSALRHSISGMNTEFAAMTIEEMSRDDTIRTLELKSGAVEFRRHVYFSYHALAKLVELAGRYLHEKAMPAKALELLDPIATDVAAARGRYTFVTADDVARIVAERARVPVSAVTATERDTLLHLEDRLHKRIVGQEEAVVAVASALRRARTELRDAQRPIASFLFLGPTGVGKTELAKTVAAVYFGDENAMVRFDMSEYQEQSSISRLLGAEAGYRGSDAGGLLTEAIRQQPFSLVLLDELEKAHPDILNLLLQVMDDGRLTDASGRTVDCTNIILIATSNAATEAISDAQQQGASDTAIKQSLLHDVLPRIFRPELLNRFDQVVVFHQLTKLEIVQIAKLLLGDVEQQLSAKGIAFEATEAAVRELADRGYDPVFGARPLRRVIQETVDNALASYLLSEKLGRRDRAILEPGGVIRVERAPSILSRQ